MKETKPDPNTRPDPNMWPQDRVAASLREPPLRLARWSLRAGDAEVTMEDGGSSGPRVGAHPRAWTRPVVRRGGEEVLKVNKDPLRSRTPDSAASRLCGGGRLPGGAIAMSGGPRRCGPRGAPLRVPWRRSLTHLLRLYRLWPARAATGSRRVARRAGR